MENNFEQKFKKALDFLENSNMSSPNKPALPHVKRVGLYLYEKGFSDDVVIAGLLHDSLEWSESSEEEIKEKFGDKILEIIKANSKDTSIEGTMNRARDMMKRCNELGDDALAVKIADVNDSCNYYKNIKNKKELDNYREFVKLLLDNMSDNLKQFFEDDLQKIHNLSKLD